jgi:C-terminal processing protease CtpA/Prc
MNMKNLFFLIQICIVAFLISACSDGGEDTPTKKPDPTPDPEPTPTVMSDTEFTNRWILDRMKRVYLWNDNLPTSPDYTKNPDDFFYSILYNYKSLTGDRFSWIEAEESTKSYGRAELGFDYIPSSYFVPGEQTSSIGLFITSVNKDSDAEAKGLKRGNLIYEVNGTKVTGTNYSTILNNSSFTLSVYDEKGDKVTLPVISASAPSQRSPVFLSKVLNVSGIKIGYLVYNAFERGASGTSDYKYDIELIESIRDLSNQGISEFVLDLRYNPGGYLTSAMDLASALVPNRDIKKVFVKEEYNKYFQDSLVAKYGTDALNEYFLDKVYGTNVDIPKLNLNRLYVIATDNSASASELVIHGLRAHMPVNHVGLTTVGKDKASITVHANNSRIKWQLQPLVSRLKNANDEGNYIDGLKPNIEVSEWNEGYSMIDAYYMDNGTRVDLKVPIVAPWIGGFKELGDPSEPMLARAIADITNKPIPKSTKSAISNKPVQVPFIKRDDKRFKTILDSDKFVESDNNNK